jgi:hypothetical protein
MYLELLQANLKVADMNVMFHDLVLRLVGMTMYEAVCRTVPNNP